MSTYTCGKTSPNFCIRFQALLSRGGWKRVLPEPNWAQTQSWESIQQILPQGAAFGWGGRQECGEKLLRGVQGWLHLPKSPPMAPVAPVSTLPLLEGLNKSCRGNKNSALKTQPGASCTAEGPPAPIPIPLSTEICVPGLLLSPRTRGPQGFLWGSINSFCSSCCPFQEGNAGFCLLWDVQLQGRLRNIFSGWKSEGRGE